NNTALAGINVSFSADVGSISAPVTTDANGDAHATLSSTSTGDAVISASAGTVALANTITVTFEGCRTAQQAFEQELYPKVFSRCQGCHNELGLARAYGLNYKLAFPGVDNWAQRNVDVITPYAQDIVTATDGSNIPRIVGKPTLRLDEGHEGGQV